MLGPRLARLVPVLLALSLAVPAFAHAHLTASTPADGEVLGSAPATVTLTFTEAVQARFSLFVVVPLAVPPVANESAKEHSQRTYGLAAQLADSVMAAGGKVDGRVDAGLASPSGASKDVVIALRDGLPAGTYVVVWRVLSIDSHVTQGIVVFTVATGN